MKLRNISHRKRISLYSFIYKIPFLKAQKQGRPSISTQSALQNKKHNYFWMGGVSIISGTPLGVRREPFPTSKIIMLIISYYKTTVYYSSLPYFPTISAVSMNSYGVV